MRKTILVYGLISGAIAAVLMFSTVTFAENISFDYGEYIGYAGIILSFTLVFFGIKSYRDRIGNGSITFGKAFMIGLLIAVISSLCYVIAWLVLYYTIYSDFWPHYAAYVIDKMKASGASQQEMDATMEQMKHYNEMYKNPFINAALTFTEPFPLGLLIALISALILKRKEASSST